MTIHQARTVSLVNVFSEGLSDALTRFKTGINGDDRAASNPIVPANFIINSRLVKPLFLAGTQKILSFILKAEATSDGFFGGSGQGSRRALTRHIT